MAKILYGVNGEGFGHSTRSIEIINFLRSQGHELFVVSSAKGYLNLSENFPVTKIFGWAFVYKHNEVKYLATALKNLMQSPEALKSLNLLHDIVADFKPQLIISDFEPFVATIAKLKNIPLLSIDNEHVITKTKYDYPKNYTAEHRVARFITRSMIFRAKAYLILSFFPCRPLNNKSLVFPPVIRQEVLSLEPTNDDYVIVYVNNEFSDLIDILKKIDARFVIYGFDRAETDANLTFKKSDQHGFLRDLAGAKAVIATAGFSLISEALYLGKPYFAMPAGHQFEQALNAYHLQKMGYGEHYDQPTLEAVQHFLDNLPQYRQALAGGIASGNEALCQTLVNLISRLAKKK